MRGFIEELRYRNVFRVAIAYIIAGVVKAKELLRPLDEPDLLVRLAGLLSYTHFDPAPYPNLTKRLEEQGVMRHEVMPLNFACKR